MHHLPEALHPVLQLHKRTIYSYNGNYFVSDIIRRVGREIVFVLSFVTASVEITTAEWVCRGGRNGIFRGGRHNRPCFSQIKNGDLQGRAREPPLKMVLEGRVVGGVARP